MWTMSAIIPYPVEKLHVAARLRLLGSGRRRRDLLRTVGSLQERLAQASARISALEHTLSQARLEALTDPLTGLANRRAFDEALRDAVARAADGAAPNGGDLSLLLLDIDHFKSINDLHGHQAGDQALRLIAGTIAGMVRRTDLAARWGGEEFAVLLPGTGRAGALSLAETLRSGIAGRRLSLGGGQPVAITVSIGAASFTPGDTPAAWLARADVALYLAKQAGRDRAIFCAVPVREGAVV
jgi:diguanylate cyclase